MDHSKALELSRSKVVAMGAMGRSKALAMSRSNALARMGFKSLGDVPLQ